MSETRGKGGGHSKGQTMPYSVLRTWDGGKPTRSSHWTIGAAEESLYETLRAANQRGLAVETSIIDRATGETVHAPQRCEVCGERWATELAAGQFGDDYTRCSECEDEDMPEAEPAAVAAQEPETRHRVVGTEPVKARFLVDQSAGSKLADPAAVPELARPLIATLRSRGLDVVGAEADGTVTVEANGIRWTLRPEMHAVTGEPCGVWSAINPDGLSRGMFTAHNAASFLARRPVA
jgi:hypothetical protein